MTTRFSQCYILFSPVDGSSPWACGILHILVGGAVQRILPTSFYSKFRGRIYNGIIYYHITIYLLCVTDANSNFLQFNLLVTLCFCFKCGLYSISGILVQNAWCILPLSVIDLSTTGTEQNYYPPIQPSMYRYLTTILLGCFKVLGIAIHLTWNVTLLNTCDYFSNL